MEVERNIKIAVERINKVNTRSVAKNIEKKRFETAVGENGTKVGRVVTTTYNKKTGKPLKSNYTDWFGVPTNNSKPTSITNPWELYSK